MEIRFSRYNAPFIEASTEEVHYISLDDQRDMSLGIFDAHVKLFFQCFPNYQSNIGDVDFLDQLFYESGIKAAGKRTQRYQPRHNPKATSVRKFPCN